MARTLTLLTVATLLAAPIAEARPARTPAKPELSAAIKTRQGALRDFNARMSRLDALMGVSPATKTRARSAEAGR
ncbi:hypothetical protein SAMN05216360_106184 [Methylobacterium phyllostachyos]|uniref:Uncharacterized protein n=1 Tax=Methylobacterium phyllostachyos TaxID=582672 RepID=A0A1G9ZA24_9HYPH|nr:hypothetical protein [Methylobacterium phyllostachyos]SDN18194.1 hypothetical protein SAMN05216360_106184 [Methylobacterium phyllostachyos]